jgi:hypothetical protein
MQSQKKALRELAEFVKQSALPEQPERALGSKPLKNPRHEKLAREYAAGATRADAWRAVFGREPNTGNASRTFRRTDIQDRVEYLRGEFCRQAGVSLASLQARYLRLIDSNVIDYFEAVPLPGGGPARLQLRDLTKLHRSLTTAISELAVDGDGAVKVKVVDRLHALDSLAKTIGAFSDKAESPGGINLEQIIAQSVKFNVVTGANEPRDEWFRNHPAYADSRNEALSDSPSRLSEAKNPEWV